MRVVFTAFALLTLISAPTFAGQPQFVDVTKAVGIHFKHHDGRSGHRYFVEPLGSGAAFLDYDRDGFQDIYFVNGADLASPQHPRSIPPSKEDRGDVGGEGLPWNALYRNNGDGTFTDVTETAGVGDTGYGMGCTVGDYDNDGFPDLYVTNFGANVLYHNNGDGTFTDVTARTGTGDRRWGASCAFADYDNDGFLDLYVTNYVKYTIESDKVCMNKGIRSYCDPRLYEGEQDVLYHNNGDGTFTDVTQVAGFSPPFFPPKLGGTEGGGRGLAVVFGDYDDDGDQDLYVANDADPNFLYRNNGDGTFTDVGLIAGVALSEDGEVENGMGADFGDYNNDGRLDLVVTNFQGQTNTLYRNEGNGLFLDVSYASQIGAVSLPYLAWGVNFFDYDNDGYQDLFVANGHLHDNVRAYDPLSAYEQPNLLFRNRRDGTYDEVGIGPAHATAGGQTGILPPRAKVSRGAAYADYDNDGDVDILVTNLHDSPDLLRNDGGNQGSWLTLKLVGTPPVHGGDRGATLGSPPRAGGGSNRDAIGARVKVTTGDTAQIREVRSGSSYLSQSDMRLHFGLGQHERIDLVEIQWPSGLKERLENIIANQILTIIEGKNR
ncbi:CRTAC1 family protein [Candidatus Poribacteria bacterium]|nr:CRTAC1 family protein [Candidatus Poribacteria bacterium]